MAHAGGRPLKFKSVEELQNKIDAYFEMFGYKLCTVATPNITSRSNWNYIKTIEVNILGDIPEDDMQRLKDLFNGGFTIWHNPSTLPNKWTKAP